METLEVISNKKRQWVKRVQWLRNVHDTPKNNLSSTAADTFGTPISNSVSKWIRSLRSFDFVTGDNPSQLFELCPLFQLTRVTFDPALPYGVYTHTVPLSNLWECFGRVWACLSQVDGSENQIAETLNFDLWPDLDLTRDLLRKY